MSASARFDRLPAYDIRACYGCGDDAAVPTLAYIDKVTGEIVRCFAGDVPGVAGPEDARQIALQLEEDRQLDLPV
jgi:hypothetical protein